VGLSGIKSGKSGGGGGLNAVFLNASLELDIWGRLRYVQAAAEAQSAATEADFAFARQSLAALVAKSLVRRHRSGDAARLAEDALRSGESLLDSPRIGSVSEVVTSRRWPKRTPVSAAIATRSVRPSRRASRLCARSSFCLGRYPAAEIAVAQRLARCPAPVPAGMPLEILERRPDVIAAERRVAARLLASARRRRRSCPASA
jgi:outer membrane protein TolC